MFIILRHEKDELKKQTGKKDRYEDYVSQEEDRYLRMKIEQRSLVEN